MTTSFDPDFLPRRAPLWRKVIDFPLIALLVSVAAFAIVFGGLSYLFTIVDLPLPEGGEVVFNALLGSAIAIAIYKLVVPRIGTERRDYLRLSGVAPWRWLAIGTGGAAVLMTAIVGLIAILGGYIVSGMGTAQSWVEIVFVAGIQAAVVEEIAFRGILFRYLEDLGGSWFALAATSALFGFAHIANDNATWFSSLAIAVEAGVMLGAAYMLSRSLWLPIGLHFGWNVTQGLVWDVPVSGHAVDGIVEAHPAGPALISGGAFGAEASVVALVLASAVGIWLAAKAVGAGHVVRPWWVRRRMAMQMPHPQQASLRQTAE